MCATVFQNHVGSTRNFTCAPVQDQQNNETRTMKILASEIKQNLEKDKQKERLQKFVFIRLS